MSKILKIEESKIVVKNGVEMQRVIFSDDKIAYVCTDNGEVYPTNISDRYIDLINTYNASHDEVDSTKPKANPSDFWNNNQNGEYDTQIAVNRIRRFGIALRVCGVIRAALMITFLVIFIILSGSIDYPIPCIVISGIDAVLGVVYGMLGAKISQLEFKPSTIITTAIIVLVIDVLTIFSFFVLGSSGGLLGIIGVIEIIYSIIALANIGRYKEWFNGEIE